MENLSNKYIQRPRAHYAPDPYARPLSLAGYAHTPKCLRHDDGSEANLIGGYVTNVRENSV